MNEQDKKFYATSAFLMIDDLKKENEKLSNFIHDFLNYCEECYENNKDSQDYPYCYIRKAEELIEKYKIGDDYYQ